MRFFKLTACIRERYLKKEPAENTGASAGSLSNRRNSICQILILPDHDSAEAGAPGEGPVSEPVSARDRVSHAEPVSVGEVSTERGPVSEPVSERERVSHAEPEPASHDGAERERVRASHDGAERALVSARERGVSADGHDVRAMRFRNKVPNRKERVR